MTSIPVYQRRRGTDPLPGYRQAIPDDESRALGGIARGVADVGRGLAHAGQAIDAAMERTQQQADVAAKEEAYAELVRVRQQIMDDPREGLVTKKGKQALAEYDSIVSFYEAKVRDVRGRLTPRQQALLDPIVQQDRQSFTRALNAHVNREMEAHAQEAHTAALRAAASDALGAASRGEYSNMAAAIQSGLGALDERARVLGWDENRRKVEARAFEGGVYAQVIEAMLEQGRTREAAELFALARPHMDELALRESKLEQRVHAAVRLDRANEAAFRAYGEAQRDPSKAFELLAGMGIRDETVLAGARKKVDELATNDLQARRQADVPLKGRFEQRLYAPGPLMSDAEFEFMTSGMSEEARGWAARKRQARRNAAAARASQSWRDQNNRNAEFAAYWESLDPEERASVDVDELEAFFEQARGPVEAHTVQRVKARQQREAEVLARGQGVPLQAFKALALSEARRAGLSERRERGQPSQMDAFMSYMVEQYVEWQQDPKNEGRIKPPPEDVRRMIGNALLYGERARSEGFLQPNRFAFEFRLRGEEFTTEGFEERNRALLERLRSPTAGGTGDVAAGAQPATSTAPRGDDGKVLVVGPPGTRPFRSPPGPDLDAWLATHPDWSVQR